MKRKTCIFKNFVMLFMAIGLFTVFVGCDDKNDEVGPLRQEVQALRADLTKEFDSKVEVKTTELQKQLDQTKAKVDQLSTKKGVTPEELNAAKQEVVNATVTKVAFDDYVKSVKSKIDNAATTSELNALKTDLGKVESRVSALETLVGKNKKALDEALENLGNTYKGQVDALKASIAANKTQLVNLLNEYKESNGKEIEKLNKRLDDMESAMNISVVSGILNSRLTSLVVVPDFVADGGGSLPIIKYTPINTPCGLITPTKGIQLKYQLNPSTVTAADIDVNNLRFKYNAPQVLSARNKKPGDLVVKAKFDKIENGVLYVWATPDDLDKAYHGKSDNNENRIDQIMLQVPSKKGDFVVNSDWVKVIYDTTARTPFLVKHEKDSESLTADDLKLAKTFDDAKAQVYGTDNRIVELAWNETKDLEKVVEAVLGNSALAREMYGFDKHFSFAIAGKYFVGRNETDQQQFLKLNGSSVSTRVYSVDDPNKEGYNKASIGREPIVAVVLKRGTNDCLVGFLKLKITEAKPVVTVYPKEYNAGEFTPTCSGEYKEVVGTQKMNEEFYAEVKMSKEDFHSQFKLYNGDGVGVVSLKAEAGDKTSYNLIYTLSADEIWANAGKTVTKTVEYRNAADKKDATKIFEIKITAKVKNAETVELKRTEGFTIDEYWYGYKDGKRVPAKESAYTTIVHNVATPKSTTDANPNNATFDNNINNAFQTKGVMLDIPDGYEYSYKFDVVANQPLKAMGYDVTIDGNTLKAKKSGTSVYQPIARIAKEDGRGDRLYYENNEFSKELLNKAHEYVKVKLVLDVKKVCESATGRKLRDVNVSIDKLPAGSKNRFDVVFVRPIKGTAKDPRHFVDAVDFGEKGSYIDMRDLVDLIDWRARKFQDYPNYYGFYGVESILADIDHITTSLTSNGAVPSTLVLKQVDINEGNKEFGRLTYKNNGSNVQNFKLYVPVTIKYKWGTITEKVTIDVNKTINGGARKRVK